MARLAPVLPAGAEEPVRRMLTYFNRSSLWLVDWTGAGEAMVLELSNDAERFRVPLSQLLELWQNLRQGQAVDWDTLERIR